MAHGTALTRSDGDWTQIFCHWPHCTAAAQASERLGRDCKAGPQALGAVQSACHGGRHRHSGRSGLASWLPLSQRKLLRCIEGAAVSGQKAGPAVSKPYTLNPKPMLIWDFIIVQHCTARSRCQRLQACWPASEWHFAPVSNPGFIAGPDLHCVRLLGAAGLLAHLPLICLATHLPAPADSAVSSLLACRCTGDPRHAGRWTPGCLPELSLCQGIFSLADRCRSRVQRCARARPVLRQLHHGGGPGAPVQHLWVPSESEAGSGCVHVGVG